jgi:anaerobic selenocysteine-containing dehydrogenase
MPTFTTACPRNCYSTCAMRVEVRDGRLVGIAAHPDAEATAGGPCLKGLSYIERVYSPDRLLHPLRRRRGGGFERVTWDGALDLIASRLAALRGDPGPRSVLFYAGSGTKGLMNSVSTAFWELYGGCTTTYGDLCWPAGLEATRLTLGDNRHSAPSDIANARLIVLWGKNPAETNIHQVAFIEKALDRGARLIVIDPRRTPSAESAELLVQVRPGTDGALALGIAHLLVARGWVDAGFLAGRVHGFEPFRAMLAEYPPVRVAEITGVAAAALERLAEAIGTVRPVTICAGFGMQRYTNSGQAMRAIIALLALTGNLGRPGAGWVYANLQSHVFSTPRDPLAFFPPAGHGGPIRVSVSTARLGADLLAQSDPPLRMAWIERGNPVTQQPQTGEVLRALRSLDYRVVVDQFLTDTAREADIVLPAKTMFEQSDVITAYWHHCLQLKQKVIEPPGEVRPESEIYWELAERLGFPPEAMERALVAPGDEAVEAYLARRLAPLPGVTLERLRLGPLPAPGSEDVAFADLVFPTPSGRIELASREAAARWGLDELPRWRPPVESPSARFPLHLLTPNTKDRIHSQFGNLPSIRDLAPRPQLALAPDDARARGLSDGDRARVFNERGSIELEVRVDHGVSAGCAVVHNGWWLQEGGGVNRLSCARETDMAHGAAFHDNAVEVERAG